MNQVGSAGLTVTLLLVSSLLFGATIFNVTSTELTEETEDENNLFNYAQKITEETSEEITTYLQTRYKLGKYYGQAHNKKIEKIVILTKSMITKTINLSDLTIELFNGENIVLLTYSGYAEFTENYDVFEHPLWNSITEYSFGLIVTRDKDNSIVDYSTITDSTDMFYISIKLPNNMAMSKGDTMSITLIPAIGIKRTIDIEAPLPMKSIVNFDI